MDWQLVLWTALNWMFSGGILYLVYQLGCRTASDSGLKIEGWRIVALLLGYVYTLAIYGTNYPDKGIIMEFGDEDKATFLGIFIIIGATYLLGYLDTRRHAAADAARLSQSQPEASS